MNKEQAIEVLNMVEAHGAADEAKRIAIEALQAEEVVHCKDCINRWDIIRCPIDDTYTVNDNDYCSFGIKKIKPDIDYDAIRI
jgi:hypothetical protein